MNFQEHETGDNQFAPAHEHQQVLPFSSDITLIPSEIFFYSCFEFV